ncbi:uncharacterized protein DUF3592 [Sinobacterium caligoides]|uniref:Uncharacterized protein DUF3592 n=1 Tax=Sinobacterium caligoides TaxID=933926 RepID=A0A3N2DDY1_9GAMM|nr:DUF3592 domain-containing protein [Sinobacterium caligoides]ROR97999.1 uncharacterized protein DUF3592 [Sinobacterium caligoides]
MRTISDVFLIVFVVGLWLFISEASTGAPTRLIDYYAGDYSSTTDGHIFQSRVKNTRLLKTRRGYKYDIQYNFVLSGKSYYSHRVNFLSSNWRVAIETVNKYPKGSKVKVYYDKSNPNYSTLEITELSYQAWGQVFAAVILAIISITLLPLSLFR